MSSIPFLTADIAPITAKWKCSCDDFIVEERSEFTFTNDGEHIWVWVEKRDFTTPEAAKRLARAMGVDPREAGWAGLKDRTAVTRQWMSFQGATLEAAQNATQDGITVLRALKHRQKLRTGQLHGNHFTLVLRDVEPARDADIDAVLTRVRNEGLPNFYGEQRFGNEAKNIERARAWIIDGGKPPRDRFEHKLLMSALQSALFNQVLSERMNEGLFARAVPGDLLRKEDTGGVFTTDDDADASARVQSWAVSPTGPMFGASMRWPEREAKAREMRVFEASGLTQEKLEHVKKAGEGTRRVMRIRPADLTWERTNATSITLRFGLPAGAYASILVRELLKTNIVPAVAEEKAPEDGSANPS